MLYAHVLPFGKHKNQPLDEVPTGYFLWMFREGVKLSSGLRAAVAAELQARGVPAPAPPSPCNRCGCPAVKHSWTECCNGTRQVSRNCARCESFRGFAPRIAPFTTEADAAASATPVLDVLTRLDDLGIVLSSDGRAVQFVDDGWHRCPADLKAIVRQCNRQLARLMGKGVTTA